MEMNKTTQGSDPFELDAVTVEVGKKNRSHHTSYWKWLAILMFSYIPIVNVISLLACYHAAKAKNNRTIMNFVKARMTCLFLALCFLIIILFMAYLYIVSIV